MGHVTILGAVSLCWFFFLMIASIRRWIPQNILTIQSVLLIGALMLLGLVFVFRVPIHPPLLLTTTTLNPITATIGGFLLAGAVEAGGGFAAASQILIRMGKSFLGLSGTIVLLVNSPTIFAMPCGRIWAAALIPAALMFGVELARTHNRPSLVPIIVFGLITNAAASCGPSPLGGIGMMGEGIGGLPMGSFSNPQQIAIMVITLATMAFIGLVGGMPVNERIASNDGVSLEKLPKTAYFTFLFYVVGLVIVFIARPPVPIQTILVGMIIIVMIVGKVGLKDLVGGVILHPITAMVAGFIMAGALFVAGAFDTLVQLLTWCATHTPLGFIGAAVLVMYIPIILPIPCGRVVVAALLPGVLMFGEKIVEVTKYPPSFNALLIGFILCCAASCGSSPIGGIGGIGEGNLGLKSGSSVKALQFGILLGLPIAALIVTFLGLSGQVFQFGEAVISPVIGVVFGAVMNVMLGEKIYKPGGIAGGLLTGILMLVM
jgi:hypothetical protein